MVVRLQREKVQLYFLSKNLISCWATTCSKYYYSVNVAANVVAFLNPNHSATCFFYYNWVVAEKQSCFFINYDQFYLPPSIK